MLLSAKFLECRPLTAVTKYWVGVSLPRIGPAAATPVYDTHGLKCLPTGLPLGMFVCGPNCFCGQLIWRACTHIVEAFTCCGRCTLLAGCHPSPDAP
jgi:hypothetical protein